MSNPRLGSSCEESLCTDVVIVEESSTDPWCLSEITHYVLRLVAVSYIQTLWLVFSLVLRSPRLTVISLCSFEAPCLANAIHFETGTQRGLAQTAARHMRSLDQQRLCTHRMTTAVHYLPLSQSCGLNREELRSHWALPHSRVSL